MAQQLETFQIDELLNFETFANRRERERQRFRRVIRFLPEQDHGYAEYRGNGRFRQQLTD